MKGGWLHCTALIFSRGCDRIWRKFEGDTIEFKSFAWRWAATKRVQGRIDLRISLGYGTNSS